MLSPTVKYGNSGASLAEQWSRCSDSSAEGVGSISGPETEILHATARIISPLRAGQSNAYTCYLKYKWNLEILLIFFFLGMLWHSRPVLNISGLYLKGLFLINPSLNSMAYRTAESTSPGSLLETDILGHACSLALPTESESVF